MRNKLFALLSLALIACGGETSDDTAQTGPGGGSSSSAGSAQGGSAGASAGGKAQGGDASGGSSQGGKAQGGQAQGGQAQGGQAQGGQAQGGQAQAGEAQGGQAQGGQAQGGQGQGGGTSFPCCVSHMVTTCTCPAGAACDAIPYEVCGDGSCAPAGETCPGTTKCGGIDGIPCAADEFCDYPDGLCGGTDGQGTCKKRPTACDLGCAIPNICGCDGKPYCNSCLAQAAGVDDQNKPCPGNQGPCCQDGVITTCTCPGGLDCGFPPFTDCGGGACVALGDKCPASKACGGIDGLPCAADEFCDYPDNMCGAADGQGTCVKRPTVCNDPCGFAPTCGCDGGEYCSPCEAHMKGTDDTAGPCGGTTEPCCINGSIETCHCDPGVPCGIPPFTDCGSGVCVDVGQTCPAITACGAELGNTCKPDEYCDFGSPMCDWADGTGACKPRPAGCPDVCDPTPACGCDGKVYCSMCDAKLSGVDASPCGSTFSCCVDGVVQQCGCAQGIDCNTAPYIDCGGGTCQPEGGMCPEGNPCFGPSDCGADQFCDLAGTTCGGPDPGVCTKRPTQCPLGCSQQGICGCDGNSYCNECEAHAAGADDLGGPCPKGNAGDFCNDKLPCQAPLACCYPCGVAGCANQCMAVGPDGQCPAFP